MTTSVSRRSLVRGIGAGAALAAAGVSLAMPRPARAATTLTFSSWLPPKHPIVVNAFEPWAEDVKTATDGRVRVRILPKPLGGAPLHFDMARDGVADITYGLHSFTPGDRFLLSRLAEFSFLGNDAAELSVAYWNQYTERFAAAGEHAGVHTLGVFAHGPGVLHNRVRPVRVPDDVKGLKLRVPGGYVSDLMGRMGATPLLAPSPEVYEMLSNGVIDGVTFTLEALTAFKLTDHLKHSTTVPGGIYNTSWFFVMNQAKWNGLEDRDKEAITTLSGEAFARRVGKAWIDADIAAMDRIKAAGIAVIDAEPAFVSALAGHATALEAAWADEAQAKRGVDGRAALAAVRAATGITLPPT
ncbi:TRAP transporter substrate-binding protein [Azospirillum halopraeferens]|uniref:TRAP transporter substrate-binding protein n=1 Tax=Azospirillum halopraeferens TaxID=34010 RepID=UPI0004202354|nr:TRAP transporter substrate-binding protein [Azospirillum halopraeferens]